jgi:hypothetical protein
VRLLVAYSLSREGIFARYLFELAVHRLGLKHKTKQKVKKVKEVSSSMQKYTNEVKIKA